MSRKAADQGNAIGQSCLGHFYENGLGVEKDARKAFDLYTKSANQNFSGGQYRLGLLYANGTGVIQNYTKAAASAFGCSLRRWVAFAAAAKPHLGLIRW